MLRARIELVLAGLFTLGAIAAAIWPTWIESLTHLDPDNGSGEAEWWLVALLGAAALAAALLGRRDLRHARLPTARGEAA
jgi:hypothetical protein